MANRDPIVSWLPFHCLICTQKYQNSSSCSAPAVLNVKPDDDDDESHSQEEREKIFNLLCRSLKIKLKRTNSWDFKVESMPFCSSCAKISKELPRIQDQIRRLEREFAEKVRNIRNLIADSEARNYLAEEDYEAEFDKRFEYFRSQVTGKVIRKSKRDFDKNAGTSSVPPKFRLKSVKKSLKIPIVQESATSADTSRRRSTRVKRKVFRGLSDSDDDADMADANDDRFQDSDDDADEYKPYDDVEAVDLKPLIEIKVEAHSENEESIAEFIDPLMHSKSDDETSSSTALTSKIIIRKERGKPKTSRYSSQNPRTKVTLPPSGSDNDSSDANDIEYKPMSKKFKVNSEDEESSSSDSEDNGDKNDSSRIRKWKSDKKSGRLWYDGLEVFYLDNGLKCSKCDVEILGDKKTNNKVKMKRHILLKHLEKHVCVLCDKVLSCKKYLEAHVKMVHEKSVVIPCNICEKPFTSTNAMRRHAWNHQNAEEKEAAIAEGKKQCGGKLKSYEVMSCQICGRQCKGPYNLKRHEETHIEHSERPKHMCQICGGLYSAPETLKSHIKTAHDNNSRLQWHQCKYCPKKFPQAGRLLKHMRCHTGEKPYKCSECSQSFSQTTLLTIHMLKHKNLRPHQCEHCEMQFRRRYHLQRHTQVYHESAQPPTKKQPYRSENGTRKPPQKRNRNRILERFDPFCMEKTEPLELTPSDLQAHVARPHHPVVGDMPQFIVTNPTPPQNSFTTNSSCTYPFNYSFPPASGHRGNN